MITIEESEYKQLKKDADDNRQVVKIAVIIGLLLALVLMYLAFGSKLIDISIKQHQATVDQEIARSEALNDVQVREIEQGDLTFDEYIQWLEAKNGSSNESSQN